MSTGVHPGNALSDRAHDHSAASTDDCGPDKYTYNWYIENQWVGSGQYYNGGREDANARICTN